VISAIEVLDEPTHKVELTRISLLFELINKEIHQMVKYSPWLVTTKERRKMSGKIFCRPVIYLFLCMITANKRVSLYAAL